MSKKQWYTSQHFTLDVAMGSRGAIMHMFVKDGIINTSQLHFVHETLTDLLPSVLESQCFNDQGLAFCEEVKATEMGHLFEHILLEYVCLLKIERGDEQATHSGRTSWNWQRDPKGTFFIYVDIPQSDRTIFLKALAKTILLMKVICNMSNHFWSPISQHLA